MAANPTLLNYLTVLPEILLVILLFVVLGYSSFSSKPDGRVAGLITSWGTVLIIAVLVIVTVLFWGEVATFDPRFTTAQVPSLHWGNMVTLDPIGAVFRFMFLLALLLTALFSLDTPELQQAEYFALLITATIGFNLMSVSADLVMLLIALETASISLYLLAGYATRQLRSSEAGMKYFVYGAFASAIMLYGLSLLYGLTGRTNIYSIAELVRQSVNGLSGDALNTLNAFILVAAVLLLVGFGFKISVVPFHWWAPDVYEGAPGQVTGFTSTASKAAGFALFIRVFTAGVLGSPSADSAWWAMLVAITIITLVLGNLLAIFQTNIKRMLAYSSIAQAGYVMIGVVSFTPEASGAVLFYLLMYVVTNIAAFGVIVLISNYTGSDEMSDLHGLSRRSPFLALAMLFALLSLGGIPPTAGFIGKFFLFRAAVNAGLWWLALIGVLAAFVSLYYYLTVVKYIYLYRAVGDEHPIPTSRAARVAMALSVFGILYLGIFAGPALEWTRAAAAYFFTG